MRTALLISGQFRNASDYFPQFKQNILDVYHPDVFISCWNPTETIFDTVQLQTRDIQDTLSISDVISIYEPKSILSEDFNSPKIKNIINRANSLGDFSIKNGEISFSSVFCMWYKIGSALSLLTDYERETGIRYDRIIKSRFDLLFKESPEFNLDPMVIRIPKGYDWRSGINDIFAMGGRDAMSYYCSLYSKIETYIVDKKILFHPETLLKYHLFTSEFDVERVDLDVYLRDKRIGDLEQNELNWTKNSR
jgi:hypothetical protein